MLNLLLYATAVLIWGSTWLVIKFQLSQVDPTLSVVYRFLLAGLVLFLFCLIRGRNLRYSRRDHLFFAAQGAAMVFGSYTLVYMASRYLTSGLLAVIFANIMALNIVNLRLFLGQPIRIKAVWGGVFGLIGIVLVFWRDITAAQIGPSLTGLLLALPATYLASISNVIAVRNARVSLPVTQSNAYCMTYGGLLTLAFYLVVMNGPIQMSWTPGYLLPLLYLSLFGSVIAFGCYYTLAGRLGGDLAAYVSTLCPIVALALSTMYENYHWTPTSVAGVVMALAGNVIVLIPTRKPIGL